MELIPITKVQEHASVFRDMEECKIKISSVSITKPAINDPHIEAQKLSHGKK